MDMSPLHQVWPKPSRSLSHSVNSKIQLMCSLVISIFLFACESFSQQTCKEEYKPWNAALVQYITLPIPRPCCQWGSLCQDPAGNQTTWRPSDHHKETQTEVVWTCLLFIRSGQNHLEKHSERVKKIRQTEKEVGRQQQGVDRPRVCHVPEGSGEQKNGGNWLWSHLWCPYNSL